MVLPLLAAAMDAAWIAPYALLLGSIWRGAGWPLLPPAVMVGLLAVSQLLTRRLLARGEPARIARAALALSGVAAALAAAASQYGADPWWRTHGSFWRALDLAVRAVRPELGAFVLAALLWRRGITTGRTMLEYYDLETMFYLGLGGFGIFAAATAFAHAEPAIARVAAAALPSLVVFFASSLTALSLARLRSIRQRTRAPEDAVAVSGDWYTLSTAVVVAILGGAAVAAAFLRFDVVALLRAVARILDPLLWAAVYVIAVSLGLLVSGIIWLVRHLGHLAAGPPPQVLTPPRWVADLPHQGPAGMSPAAATAVRWGAAALLVALLLLWLSRSLFRYERAERDAAADETRESVWAWPDLLRAALAPWRRRRPPRRAPSGPDFGRGPAGVVRRAYAELLGIAAARGYPRPAHVTPVEFARALRTGWPEAADLVGLLTHAYSSVRYGLIVPQDGEVDEVRATLARLRGAAGSANGPEGRG